MPDPQNTVSQRDDKYWIKHGTEVAHRDFPNRKMIVDDILKKTETIMEDNKAVSKTFTVGVECHWFGTDDRYDRGRFLTMELIPFGKKQTSKPDLQSFPKEIPSS